MDFVSWGGSGYEGQVWTNSGALYMQVTLRQGASAGWPLSWGYHSREATANVHLPGWRRWLITWRAGPMDDPARDVWDRVLTLPLWCLLMGLCVFPLLAGWRVRRWMHARWQRQQICIRCGYDLRGSAGACPECGWSAAPRTASPRSESRSAS